MVDKQKELKLLLQSLLTWVFPSCTSEAASISGSVDDVVEDELLWDQRYSKNQGIFSQFDAWFWTFASERSCVNHYI